MRGSSGGIVVIKSELLRDAGILILEPLSTLSVDDFHEVARMVDPYIIEHGKLTGLLIAAPSFPGWESFGALIEHLRFVYDHHRKIERVAAVTDSPLLQIAPTIAAHFAHPEIRVFAGDERDKALGWLKTGS
jgi:SpoIIAA-like